MDRIGRIKLPLFMLISVLGTTHPTAVFSNAENQENDYLMDFSLEDLFDLEIEVASLFKEKEVDVGSTVALITEQQWKKQGARMTNDAIANLPGTMISPTLGGSDVVAIRGYSTKLSVRGIATLLDGVPLNTLAWGTALYDKANINLGVLDRIEMVRGPGSTIYGSDAFHGVYSLKSFRSDTDIIVTEIEEGNDGYHSANVRVSRGIGDDVRMDSAISINSQQDQNRTYLYTDATDDTEVSSSRAHAHNSHTIITKLSIEPTDIFSANVGLYHHVFDAKEVPGLGTSLSAELDIMSADSEFTMLKGGVGFNLDNDITLTADVFSWVNKHAFSYTGFNNYLQKQDESRAGISLIAKQPDNDLNTQWLVGLGQNRSKITDTGIGFIPVVGVAPFQGLERTVNNLFVQTKTGFNDDTLLVLFGFRVDDYSDFGRQTTPRAGIIYKPSYTSAIKLLYGNAFRAAVGGELTSAGSILGSPDIKPEVIDTYELIYVISKENSKFSATVFRSEWKEAIIIEVFDEPLEFFASEYVNRGVNEASGIELEGRFQLNSYLFEGSFSYITSESVSSDLDYAAFPKYIINVGINYSLPKYKLNFYLSERIHLDAKDRPANSSTDIPEDLKDYFRTDLNVSYQYNEDTNIVMNIRNLFDRDNFLPSMWGAENGVPEAGVSATLRVSYQM